MLESLENRAFLGKSLISVKHSIGKEGNPHPNIIMYGGWIMQDELRDQVIAYLNQYMLRKSSLSSYLGISPQYLSDWLHKRCDFNNGRVQMIKNFLTRKFY